VDEDKTQTIEGPGAGKLIAGRFQIVRPLGSGGMGQVFEAFDLQLGQSVAVKLIRSDLGASAATIARFKREVLLGREVSHPNLCRVFDIGSHVDVAGEEVLFLTMELIHGPTLSSAIGQKSMPVAEAEPLILQMVSALAALHKAGIVHRDFKPGNVMLARSRSGSGYRAIVTDFGLAFDAGSESSGITGPHRAVGTPAYMAPEQILGLPPTRAVDVFAIGLVIYEMLTGRLPFEKARDVASAAKRVHQLPAPPSTHVPGLQARWDSLVLNCLQPEPAHRPPDAAAVLALLQRGDPAPVPAPSHTRRRMLAGAGAGILVLAFLFGFVLPGALRHRPPGSAAAHYARGVRLLADGAAQAALNELGAATQIDPRFTTAHLRRSEAALALDDFDEAQSELLEASTTGIEEYLLLRPDRMRLRAVRASVLRSYAVAENEYRDLVGAVPREEQPEALLTLANTCIRNQEPAAALDACQRALSIDPDYAPAVLLSAVLYARQREDALAVPSFERAIALNRNAANLPGRVQALIAFAQMLSTSASVQDLDRARLLLSEAAALSHTLGDRYLEVQSMLLESELSFAHGDPPGGERIARQALDLARQSGNEALVLQASVKLGRSLVFGSKLDEAEKAFREVLDAPPHHAVPREQARASAELAQVRLKQQRAAEALPLLSNAAAYFTKAGARHDEARVMLMTGQAQREQGQFADCLASFRRALDLSLKTNDTDLASLAEQSTANTLMIEEVYPEALKHLEADLKLLGPSADPRLLMYNKLARADALWRSGDLAAAGVLMDELLRSPVIASEHDLALDTYVSAGEIAVARREFGAAARSAKMGRALASSQNSRLNIELELIECSANRVLNACRQGLETAEKLGTARLVRKARLALAEAQLEAGHPEDARASAQQIAASLPPQGFEVTRFFAASLARDPGAAQAALARIHSVWGEEAYRTFLNRPDVRYYSGPLKSAETSVF
jgi:Tfp pilus assembly protein PilF